MTIASHAIGPRFDPGRKYFLFLTQILSTRFIIDKIYLSYHRWLSSVVEHGIADPAVTGSNPVVTYPGWCSW